MQGHNINRWSVVFLSALTVSAAVQAATVNIPEKVKADILKRHPNAQDLQASPEIHFQRKLLEVSFKVEGEEKPLMELFREDGHLFTNELPVDDISEASSVVRESLDVNFPNHQIKKIEMIANPNGVGEEYEIYLQSGGANWKVSVNQKGEIVAKDTW